MADAGRVRSFDLLGWSPLYRLARGRYARTVPQSLILLLAAIVVFDGLVGRQVSPLNMAGVLPWVVWRGLVVLGLLAIGNAFCFVCPVPLASTLGGRLAGGARHWPAALRGKWLASALLVGFLWLYESTDAWASPRLTALIVVGLFAAPFVLGAIFRGAAFCKNLCPIGHFGYVCSTCSPFAIGVREPGVCSSCAGKECIVGTGRARRSATTSASTATRSGCQLGLFAPAKAGSLDCTYCLDCIGACSHDNVGLLARVPASELAVKSRRSGVGLLRYRVDYGFLALVISVAGLTNAFGMTGLYWELWSTAQPLAPWLSEGVFVGLLLIWVVAVGAFLTLGAAALTALASSSQQPVAQVWADLVWSLTPVAVGMWSAHYLFHFLSGAGAVVPLTVQFLETHGIGLGITPDWSIGPLVPSSWLLPIQVVVLEVGALLSLTTALRLARSGDLPAGKLVTAFAPWCMLVALYLALAVLILLQPMEMRGSLAGGG
jgi:polyferredoxin